MNQKQFFQQLYADRQPQDETYEINLCPLGGDVFTIHGEDDFSITGHFAFVTPSGQRCDSLRAAITSINRFLMPHSIEVIPKTAELKILLWDPQDMREEERGDNADDYADQEPDPKYDDPECVDIMREIAERRMLHAESEYRERLYSISTPVILTGDFVAINARSDGDLTTGEFYRRRVVDGQEILTILEAERGWRTTCTKVIKGKQTAQIIQFAYTAK